MRLSGNRAVAEDRRIEDGLATSKEGAILSIDNSTTRKEGWRRTGPLLPADARVVLEFPPLPLWSSCAASL
jgi:hypothetical protein